MRANGPVKMQTQTTNRDPYMKVSGHHSAVLEMKEVLSLRLPSFYRCALRVLGNAADAEDAVQDALLAAYRHIDQFRGQSQMTTWLTTIVRNCALMRLRKRPRQIHLSLDEPTGGDENTSFGKDSRTRGPARKRSVASWNSLRACKNAPYGCRLLCGEHFSCVS
jgi:DNA-directed RNA polymerase specialized sigma24 family protein